MDSSPAWQALCRETSGVIQTTGTCQISLRACRASEEKFRTHTQQILTLWNKDKQSEMHRPNVICLLTVTVTGRQVLPPRLYLHSLPRIKHEKYAWSWRCEICFISRHVNLSTPSVCPIQKSCIQQCVDQGKTVL